MTDMGVVRWFLGMSVTYMIDRIHFSQTSYIKRIIERFNLQDAKIKLVPPAKDVNFKQLVFPDEKDPTKDCPYRELTGCLQYLSICTRPDIALAVSELFRFVSKPHCCHWELLKGIVI